MKYFFIGMFVMLIVMKPQVLAGIAQGLANAFNQPQYPYPVERGRVIPQDSLDDNERLLGAGDLQLLEKYNELSTKLNQPTQPVHSNPVVNHTVYTATTSPVVHSPAKVAAYQKALVEQEVLERFVNYSGDDPTVRARLGLNPIRITTIEKFEFEGEDTYNVGSFNKLFSTRFKN